MQAFEALVFLEENALLPNATVTASMCTRSGHNRSWNISNNSPSILHKARKLQIDVDAPVNTRYTLLVQLKCLYGAGSRESCYLSLSERCRNEIRKLSVAFDENSPRTFVCFLKTLIGNNSLPRVSVLYQMTISIAFEGHSPITIHQWQLKPTKNHKCETTLQGKFANNLNATPIHYPIYLPLETGTVVTKPAVQPLEFENIELFNQPLPPDSIANTVDTILEDCAWFDDFLYIQ